MKKNKLLSFILVIMGIFLLFNIPSYAQDIIEWNGRIPIPQKQKFNFSVPKINQYESNEDWTYCSIYSSGIQLQILKVEEGYNENYWEITYKGTGTMSAGTIWGSNNSRTANIRINNHNIYWDDSNYGENSKSHSLDGTEHTMSVSKDYYNPMQLTISYSLYARSSDHRVDSSRTQHFNMNTSPYVANQIDRKHMNGKDSTSITVKGKVRDIEQDDITVTAEIKDENRQTILTKTKYIDIPNKEYGQNYDYQFTFNLSEFTTDVNGKLCVTAKDHYGDTSAASYPIYIDRIDPIISTNDNHIIKGGTKMKISTNEPCDVYLLKNNRDYNLFTDVENALSIDGYRIGNCDETAILPISSAITGSYRLYAVDRGKNVSNPFKNIIQIDSQKPELLDVIVEGNKIKFIYEELMNPKISASDNLLLPIGNIISSSVCILSDEDRVDYEFIFDDYESDEKFTDRFVFSAFDNSMFTNPNGIPDIVGNTATTINSFHEVGRYSLEYQAQDTPIEPTQNNFSNYRKWSNKNNIDLLVHRRPIANLSVTASIRSGKWIINNINGSGYDLDHMDMSNKGIVEEKYEWKNTSDTKFTLGKMPNGLPTKINNKDTNYIIKYMVKDIEGVWSKPKTFILNLSLKFDAELKCEKGQPLNHVSTDQNLITFNATTTCPYGVHLELALFDEDGIEQILETKKVNFTQGLTGNKIGTNILWNDINYYIPKGTKEDWYKFKVTAISDDGQQLTKEWRVYLVNNTPPTVTISSKFPTFIYEGDNVSINIDMNDADKDDLNLQIELFMIAPMKKSMKIDNYKIGYNSYNTNSFTQNYINLELGEYKVEAIVDDGNGGTAKATCNLKVNDLSLEGMVTHTPIWNENRIKYNQSITQTDDSPRTSNTFWSGERFLLGSKTTPINNTSSVKANYVHVKILYQSPDIFTYLEHDNTTSQWSGKLWNKDMIHKWGLKSPENLTFRFTVEYSNGHSEIDDVIITVDDTDGYWQYHRKF
ncbi:hypothetical protein AN1V17_15240 [Vallitalea sediminicola]